MKVVLFFALITTSLAALPNPKPIVHAEVYQKQQCGPFLEVLSKKNAERLRRILDQEDLTKKEIDQEVEEFVAAQDEETQDKYASFKRALKLHILKVKLRHELKMKNMSDEAKRLDEKVQNVIEDKDLTWPETIKAKNDLLRKAAPKVLKELGIKPIKTNKEEDPEEEDEEGGDEDPQNGADYEHTTGGKYDYHQNGGNTNFGGEDYPNSENSHFGDNGMRKPSKNNFKKRRPAARARGGHEPDYHNNGDDFEH